MFLICHMTSPDHLIERACEFMGGNSLCYVTTLISLVTIGIVMVEMFLICHIISLEHMFKWLCEFLGGTRHGESPSCHVWWSLVYTLFFIRKPFFCLSLNFLNIILICKLRWNFPNNFRNFYAFISYNCIFS